MMPLAMPLAMPANFEFGPFTHRNVFYRQTANYFYVEIEPVDKTRMSCIHPFYKHKVD